jgi:hypothetical protein
VPSSDRSEQIILAREPDGLHDIIGRSAAGNQRWRPVDHRVPDLSHLIVVGVPGKKHLSPEMCFEFVNLCSFQLLHDWLLSFYV